jgi:NO-binding membrane sensor protein with MHYT domain
MAIPAVGDTLRASYDVGVVAWSYLFSVVGSFIALECAHHLRRRDGSLDGWMLFNAALMLGGVGIWTMHFIGMQAYKLPVPIGYDGLLTAVSLIAAVAISALALYLAGGSKGFNVQGWIVGGVVAGIGVCVMHYMGMYAMVMNAQMALNLTIVSASLGIAIVAALAALWLAFNVRRRSLRTGAALVMGAAVCTMHYTGMAAASMVCIASAPSSAFKIAGRDLALWTYFVAFAAILFVVLQLMMRAFQLGEQQAPARRAA